MIFHAVNLTVPDVCIGQRVDVFLAGNADGIASRSAAQRLLSDGYVRLNHRIVPKNYRVCAGDVFELTLPNPEPGIALPEDIPLDIVYEDSDLIVVNKPRGLVVHPAAGNYTGTLVNALLHHSKLSEVSGPVRPGIVHRLDKDTGGLIVVAKNDAAHVSLASQLAERKMGRVYHGLAFGRFKQDAFTVDLPIGRHPIDRKKMAVVFKPGAKIAVTHLRALEKFDGRGKLTLFEARLETGRTHQIRVHLANMGHPVYGDIVYGRGPESTEGQLLFAVDLSFVHPVSGDAMRFTVPCPDYFDSIIERLRRGGNP